MCLERFKRFKIFKIFEIFPKRIAPDYAYQLTKFSDLIIYDRKYISKKNNAHYDVTDFKLDFKFYKMLRNKASYLRDGKCLFNRVKKLLNLSMKMNLLRKHNFLVGVTLKVT